MRAAGIEDPSIGPPIPRVSSGSPVLVRGTVRDVTHAKLERIGAAAAAYVASHPGAVVDNVGFVPRLDDCAATEQAARAAALAEARRKADAIAALAGLSIDAVAAVSESGGCPSFDNAFNGPGQFDLGTLTTTLTVTEYVTYAISPGTPSTRRRTL
jgi:hypothetical protein